MDCRRQALAVAGIATRESARESPARLLVGEGRPDGNEISDLGSFAAFLGPELHRDGGADRAADVIEMWADSVRALLVEAETVALRRHHSTRCAQARRGDSDRTRRLASMDVQSW